MTHYLLSFTCPDTTGIVARITSGLAGLDAWITENAQFSDVQTGTFVMRTAFHSELSDVGEIRERLLPQVEDFGGNLTVRPTDERPRVLIMVSKYDHCLLDLLYRHHSGELSAEIPLIVSNHPDLGDAVRHQGFDFVHIPVTRETKPDAEAQLKALVNEHDIDLVVLARYMQILSEDMCDFLRGRAINIHHSFLPGFKGAKPYHQAWERGVKQIGATAHYVTSDLDEGPIIAQDVKAVTHADSVEAMVTAGRDIERLVLSRAVRAHVEDRVFQVGHRTVVFT